MRFIFFALMVISLCAKAESKMEGLSIKDMPHVLIVISQVTDYGGGWSTTSMQSFSTFKRCEDAANRVLQLSKELLKRGEDQTVKVECVPQ